MTCTSPFLLKRGDSVVELPCGRCLACRIARSREWASRIVHEMVYYKDTCFICLTYSDEFLPVDYGLHKDHLQKFFKRLRKNSKISLRYFACGEYGDQFGRPHFHAIIFGLGLSQDHKKFIQDAWTLGRIHFGTVTFNSARYVAGYVLKKYNGKMADDVYKGRGAPFCLMSKGIGRRFVLENRDYLEQNLGFTVQGSPVGLPRYYKNLCVRDEDKVLHQVLDLDKQSLREEAIERSREIVQTFKDRGLIDDDDFNWSLMTSKKSSREQADLTLNAKTNLRKRKI